MNDEPPLPGADISDPNNNTQKVGDAPRFTNGFEAIIDVLLPQLSDRDVIRLNVASTKEIIRRNQP